MTALGAATWIGASKSAFCAGAAGARKVLSQGGAQRARRQPRWKRLEIAAKIWTDDGRRKAAEMLELTLEVRDCPRVTIPSSTVSTSSPACLREHDVRAVLCGFFCFSVERPEVRAVHKNALETRFASRTTWILQPPSNVRSASYRSRLIARVSHAPVVRALSSLARSRRA